MKVKLLRDVHSLSKGKLKKGKTVDVTKEIANAWRKAGVIAESTEDKNGKPEVLETK